MTKIPEDSRTWPNPSSWFDGGDADEEHEALLSKYPKKKKLNRKQINKAIMDLEDAHPLKAVVAPHHIGACVACMPCFKSHGKVGFRIALREVICNELGFPIPESEQGLLEKPYLLGGYGINAYFNILDSFRMMFIMITLFSLPLYYQYGTSIGLKGWKSFVIGRWSIGNLGGASMACKQQILSKGQIRLLCPPNSLLDAPNAVFGVMSNQFSSYDICHQDELDKEILKNGHANCSTILKHDKLQKAFIKQCNGKQKCAFKTEGLYQEAAGIFDDRTHIDPLIEAQCYDESYLFLQSPCIVPRSQQTTRKLIGLYIACLGVFIYLFVQIWVEYIRKIEENNYIEWDVQTITAADYSVEFTIIPAQFENFKNTFYDPTNPISEIAQFKLYIRDEMQNRLTSFPNLGYDDDGDNVAGVKIAMVTFAYDNERVIKSLLKRGMAIKKESYVKINKINKKIIKQLSNDQDLLDKMQTPCAIFMSLETEEGFNRAVRYNETVEQYEEHAYAEQLLGYPIDVKEASEPTDIIWENRHWLPSDRFKRKCIVFGIIFTILFFSFKTIFFLQKKSLAMKGRYPKMLCDDYIDQYNDRRAAWQNDAVSEYRVKTAQLETSSHVFFTGPMQCFCKQQKKEDYSESEEYTLTDKKGNEVFTAPICEQYFVDIKKSKILGQSIAFIVVFINIILKLTVKSLVNFIGEATASEQKATVTRGVFLGQFANTGLVMLLVNANLTEHFPDSYITSIFQGPYYDYMPMWFIDAGLKIQIALIIQMIMPWIACTIAHVVPGIKRNLDNGCSGNKYKTKSTTIQKYKHMNGGAEYMIHFKYSDCLNVTFCALLYGLCLPILFPIAAITLKNQQLAEKIVIAWIAKLPPAMDNSLNNNAMKMVSFAPIFLLLNGFWLVDNRVIFDNHWEYIMRVNDSMKSGHAVQNFWDDFKIKPATPLLLFIALSLLRVFIRIVPEEYLRRFGFSVGDENEISVDEDLPNFFQAIKVKNANNIIFEYHNMKDKYGIEIEDAEVIRKLENISISSKTVQGTPWYNILTNYDYVDRLNYLNPVIQDRTDFVKDVNPDKNVQSDFLVILLNLSAIPDEVFQQFSSGIGVDNPNFQEEFLATFERYRQKFERRYGTKWEFQNQYNVRRYIAYKRKRQGQAETKGEVALYSDFSKGDIMTMDQTGSMLSPDSRGPNSNSRMSDPRGAMSSNNFSSVEMSSNLKNHASGTTNTNSNQLM